MNKILPYHSKRKKNFFLSRSGVRAFTLIELLVVIAIIGLLATLAVISYSTSMPKARDAKRKADLKQMQKALELYYNDNNTYPSTGGGWRGSCATYGGYPTSGAGAYIPNISPTYVGVLPTDPSSRPSAFTAAACGTSPTQACYLYNSNGAHYKLLAHCTIENAVPAGDPFADTRWYSYMVCDGDPTACAW